MLRAAIQWKVRAMTERNAERHFPALDGLRGFAALYVIVCHFAQSTHSADDSILQKLWGAVVDMGWCGVDLFFVLSGFLITGILLRARGSRRYFLSFYGRRVLRIFPLYYGLCIIALVVVPFVILPLVPGMAGLAPSSNGHTVYYWLFLNNFVDILAIAKTRLLTVTWSLATEEQFYLVWPFLIWSVSSTKAFYAICAIFVGQFVLRNVLYAYGTSTEALYYWSFTHLDGIALGSILGIAWSDRQKWSGVLRALRLQVWITVPALIALAVYAALNPVTWHISFHPTMVTVGFTLCALVFTGLLLNCLERDNWVTRVFRARALQSCGRYSYAMYLLHFPIFLGVAKAMSVLGQGKVGEQALQPAIIITAFLVTYALSALSWHAMESRVLALKRFFPFTNDEPTTPRLSRPKYAGRPSKSANATTPAE